MVVNTFACTSIPVITELNSKILTLTNEKNNYKRKYEQSCDHRAIDKVEMDNLKQKVLEMQDRESKLQVENSTLPDWYIQRGEPTTQPGKNMGLQLILDAHSDVVESFSVSRDFEGFTGLITDPGSFPLTDMRGFEVRPGHNNMVAVSAVQIGADDDLRDLDPETRGCIFPDETDKIVLHKSYKQANCFLECTLIFAQARLKEEQNLTSGCTPWYFPFVDEGFKMCDPWQTVRINDIMENDVPSDTCNYCLPDCIRTIYSQSVSAQPFRRCDERNFQLTDLCNMNYPDVSIHLIQFSTFLNLSFPNRPFN